MNDCKFQHFTFGLENKLMEDKVCNMISGKGLK